MGDAPINFDWVKARAECCPELLFQTLREVLDSDVKSANRIKLHNSEFSISTPTKEKIIVGRTKDFGGQIIAGGSVVFELAGSEILAREGRHGKRIASAKPELSSDNECLLRVEGEATPLRLWQFSKKTLEDLFFGS